MLADRGRWRGTATVRGRLYRIDNYPGFVPDEADGRVKGDLFELPDPDAVLALLDEYEECSARFPEPREYCRIVVRVETEGVPADAWAYAYAYVWPVRDDQRIESGDFLA
jgi:gamma-glutamylcyclotransferase (GGCT)/AIG2-like uncharacterized protein YtfP